jgi:hypothetical protein
LSSAFPDSTFQKKDVFLSSGVKREKVLADLDPTYAVFLGNKWNPNEDDFQTWLALQISPRSHAG